MDRKTLEIVRRFVNAFEELGIRVESIMVFGSSSHGKTGPDSDLDLAVISQDFEGLSLFERIEITSSARINARLYERPMDILAYTPDELARAEEGSFLADEIRGKGIPIRV